VARKGEGGADMSKASLKCMFDTNVFNRLLDGAASLATFGQHVIPFATAVQRKELQNTPDASRRAQLMEVFHEAVASSVETESLVMDTSGLGEAKLSENRIVHTSSGAWGAVNWGEFYWSGNESLYPKLRAELDRIEVKSNNVQDALIADTAIRGGYVLITDDRNLATVTKENGGRCFSVSELQHEGGNDGTER
jgi:predicted nucleic acid-binding protein